MATEREIQAAHERACSWIVYPTSNFNHVQPVECRAGSAAGAYRVAESEHPGVQFGEATPGYFRR